MLAVDGGVLVLQVSSTRRRASTMDKREVHSSQTHARDRKPVQTCEDLDCSRKPQEGAAGGIHFLASFQENLEGRSSMKSYQLPQLAG